MPIWKKFLLCAVVAVVYQTSWGVAFGYVFPRLELEPAAYPAMVRYKLMSELLLYGGFALWFVWVKPGQGRLPAWFGGLVFVVLFGLTLWSLLA